MSDVIGISGNAMKNHLRVLLLEFCYSNFLTSKKQYLLTLRLPD